MFIKCAILILQIQKYMQQLKENPCSIQSQELPVQQRCKSTHWIVLASFMQSVFGLDGKVYVHWFSPSCFCFLLLILTLSLVFLFMWNILTLLWKIVVNVKWLVCRTS